MKNKILCLIFLILYYTLSYGQARINSDSLFQGSFFLETLNRYILDNDRFVPPGGTICVAFVNCGFDRRQENFLNFDLKKISISQVSDKTMMCIFSPNSASFFKTETLYPFFIFDGHAIVMNLVEDLNCFGFSDANFTYFDWHNYQPSIRKKSRSCPAWILVEEEYQFSMYQLKNTEDQKIKETFMWK